MTTAPNVSLYHCDDGTEFPVEWPSDDAPRHTWRWNEDHHPRPLPPLIAALDHGRKPGGEKAYAEADVDPPHMFREWTIANGFQYIRASPLQGDELETYQARSRALAARCGGPTRVWDQYSLPRIPEACERLRGLPAESSVHDAAFLHDYAFQLTHVGGPTVLFPVLNALQGILVEALGPEGALLAQEVSQGGANDTIASDQAVWEMGQLARSDPEAMALVTAGASAAGRMASLSPDSPFRQALEAYIDKYRFRAEVWDAFELTLGENPGLVLSLISRAMDAPSPAAMTDAGDSRRRDAISRVEAALAGRPPVLMRFRELVDSLEGYVGVREGRALWQLIATGSLRHALLKKGSSLAARGWLEAPEDVFFLLPDEVDAGTSGTEPDHRIDVQQRKREWEHWRTKRPPATIGAEPSGVLPLPLPVVSSGPVLLGLAASRGTVTALVRLMPSLDEADSFEPGEVLVCAMTSPPWTPLFGSAAAVVTDSGTPLSHPAIAAREYGIPCVVGAKDATRKLRTGMLVTVDGTAGTVTIERE